MINKLNKTVYKLSDYFDKTRQLISKNNTNYIIKRLIVLLNAFIVIYQAV